MVYMSKDTSLGLDVGSTTVKLVLTKGDSIIYQTYQRHQADVRGTLARCLDDLAKQYPDLSVRVAVTGSGGLGVSQAVGMPFVQEVMAETEAVRRRFPSTDVIIELGGEDAKITYLTPVPEQRMNGTCAGGTGAFIDQMAQLLQTDAAGLDRLAEKSSHLYPIASRCGVFAKTDLQPLLNEGAPREDLAASVLQAVVTQTIAGLACGRPIRGHVVLLGGPFHFMASLRGAFQRTLAAQVDSMITPDDAQLFVALGAALLADHDPVPLSTLLNRLQTTSDWGRDVGRMRPLFMSAAERSAFTTRHARTEIPVFALDQLRGDCYLGIDAGSTTTKAVLIDQDARIFFTYYTGNQGDPVACTREMLETLYRRMDPGARIARACVTGYGEGLIQAAFGVDDGEIETVTHTAAARHFLPQVDFVIDIGGQDMKCMHLRDGMIDSIMLNEACSSGCGSFIQTFAETMGMDVQAFSQAAMTSDRPVDLGTRCTVFMNSRVKQAQKEGATIGDISAGLSYAVVRNALYKVIKIRDTAQLGERIVVLGGTFLNDAILRCFELITEREVIRPGIAGLMGAYGAALTARSRDDGTPSTLISPRRLRSFSMTTRGSRCRLCGNQCRLSIARFGNGKRFVSGNRCERGAGAAEGKLPHANLFAYKYDRLFAYEPLSDTRAWRGTIGVPRVLNMYENYPFWHTTLTRLGFRVLLSGRSTHQLFEQGMETIPSESVCYPAKLVHGHIMDLVGQGVETIFYPDLPYEQNENKDSGNHYNCPIVTSYPEVIRANMDVLRTREIRYLNPFLPLHNPRVLARKLVEVFSHWRVGAREAWAAVRAGLLEQARYRADVRAEGARVLQELRTKGKRGIVLAGRPYHVDPEVHHGIPDLINGLGLAVLSEDSIAAPGRLSRPIRVVDQWMYHTRLYEAAAVVAATPELELVQLNSFGCGLDAVTSDQVQEILAAADRMYTLLKIDEVSNLGAARIRIRSLQAAMEERARTARPTGPPPPTLIRQPFTREMKKKHTLLAPQMSPVHFALIQAVLNRHGYQIEILEKAGPADVETGLRYVNNDACYPSLLVVGQLIHALQSGRYDPDACTLVITQTGGACRATNYIAFLRKALLDAGFGQVPVLSLSVQGLEANPGFHLTPRLAQAAVRALVVGDLLQSLVLRVRPYERVAGSTDRLYRQWLSACVDYFHPPAAPGKRTYRYRALIRSMVAAFAASGWDRSSRKPRVGLVGEILVKYHPDANNQALAVIESEGCEASLPGLLDFFLYGFFSGVWKTRHLGASFWGGLWSRLAILWFEWERLPVRRALRSGTLIPPPVAIGHLARLAQQVLSIGNASGEGWLLTAEMIELIEQGVPNIICAQPFACLPNHVTGKGMIREIRRLYPQANMVPVDYDPGASEVNQLNRIKLMIAAGLRQTAVPAASAPRDAI